MHAMQEVIGSTPLSSTLIVRHLQNPSKCFLGDEFSMNIKGSYAQF